MSANTSTSNTYPEPTLNAYELSDLACTQFDQIASLFGKIASGETNEYSEAKKLASIGKYLCDDWAGFYDIEQEANKHNPVKPVESGQNKLDNISLIARSILTVLNNADIEDIQALNDAVTVVEHSVERLIAVAEDLPIANLD